MLIAIPIANGKLCAHFGHCEQFALVEADPATKQIKSTKHLTPPPHEPGVLSRWLHEPGADVVLAGAWGNARSSCSRRTTCKWSSARPWTRRKISLGHTSPARWSAARICVTTSREILFSEGSPCHSRGGG